VKAVIDPPSCRPRLALTETLVGSLETGAQSQTKFEWPGPIYSDGHVQDWEVHMKCWVRNMILPDKMPQFCIKDDKYFRRVIKLVFNL